jgi:hypothetical protein
MRLLLILISCFLAGLTVVPAQQLTFKDVERVRAQIKPGRKDTVQVLLLGNMAQAFLTTSLDSALYYADTAMNLAREIRYRRGIYRSLDLKGLINKVAGNKAVALKLFQEVLIEMENDGDAASKAVLEIGMAQIVYENGNMKEAYQYLTDAKIILQQNDPGKQLSYVLQNMGIMFMDTKQYDSAEVYFKEAITHATRELLPVLYANQGDLECQQGYFGASNQSYSYAMLDILQTQDANSYAVIYLGKAKLMNKWGFPDTAIFYANYAMQAYTAIGNPQGQLQVAALLSNLYNKDSSNGKKVNADSTIKYLKIILDLDQTVFSQQAARKDQAQYLLNREEENERRLKKEEDARQQRSTMEIIGIGAFIPLFFGLVLWLGRVKVRKRVLTFIAALSLLFLFEFITLLLHPVFGHWTNESPFLMFLLLVLVASVLVPMHHKSEKWLMAKLVHKDDVPDTLPDIEPTAA